MFRQNLINISGQTYRTLNEIGAGGYAVIYKGVNIHTNETVAIRIANQMTQDEYNIHQILIKQKKKFLIDIKGLEWKQENGKIIIVMEMGKEDFYSFMGKDEFKQVTNLDKNLIFHQMVSAVDELHQMNYFHRDLKPENFILIENSNQTPPYLKMIDFGLCKHIQNQNRQTQEVGTFLFMAPEVMNSDNYNNTSDIWSLGCIYYEMMANKSFLEFTNYSELTTQLQNIQQYQIDKKIDDLPQMNQDEKMLLKRIMQKDANQRLSLKEILQQLDYLTKRNVYPIQFQNNFPKFPNQIQQQQFQNVPMQNIPFQPQILNQQQQQDQFVQQQNWNQQQQSASVIRLQTQIKNDINQQYQELLQEEISQFKMQFNEQYQQEILKKQIELEQQNQQALAELEEKIKKEHDLKIQQYQNDKEKLNQLQIQFELDLKNRLNQFKLKQNQELEQNLQEYEQKIKKEYETILEQKIKEKETQIYIQIENEQKYILEQKLKELNDKQLKLENERKEQQFQIKKQTSLHIINCYVELVSQNQRIVIEKQKVVEQFKNKNEIQISLITSKVNMLLQEYESNKLSAHQVIQNIQNRYDSQQLNSLNEVEVEYQEKIQQLTKTSFQNIQQIDQEIQKFNQTNSKSEEKMKEQKMLQREKLSELNSNIEQRLHQLKDNLNQMRQQSSILLQGCQEYEMTQLIQRLNREIELVNQSDFKLNLIKNQFEQMKDSDSITQLENLEQQCKEMEKQNQNQGQNLKSINSDFIENEKIVLEKLDNLKNEVEDQLNHQKHKSEAVRKEFQDIQVQWIDDCENKIFEIQNLIKKIQFQRQQFCIKKQKQTFDQIKQKFEEFNILYEQSIKYIEYDKEIMKCKQQLNEIMQRLIDQKQQFESQISIFQKDNKKFSVDMNIQYQLEQQLDILNQDFNYYVQKFQGFQQINFELTNNNANKDCQLDEFKKSFNEQETFYKESEFKFKVQFQEIQSIYFKIDMIQKIENEKWSQFNNLCQKVHQFKQKSKSYRFSQNFIFCENLSQIEKLEKYLSKYQKNFDKCDQHYQQNEKIHKESKVELQQNLDQFKTAKEQNLLLIDLIKTVADQSYQNLIQFNGRIFNKYKENIKKFIKDSSFYEKIYQSFKSYQEMMTKVDSLDAEIQIHYTNSNQYDQVFYNQKISEINLQTAELEQVQQSLNSFQELDFQVDKNNFVRLVLFILVIQYYILNENTQRQLNFQIQQKEKQNQRKQECQNIQSNKYEELKNQMIQYQNNQIKFEQFLSLNEMQYSEEYFKQIEKNDLDIENQFNDILQKNRVKLRAQINNQETIKKVLDDYCATLELSRFIIKNQINVKM